jgi:hypothetical protein
MAFEDVVAYLVALALPLWLLVEQGTLWIAASRGERRAQPRIRRAHETLRSQAERPKIEHEASY